MSEKLDAILEEGYVLIDTSNTNLQVYGKDKERILFDTILDVEISRYTFHAKQPKSRLFYNGRGIRKIR